MHFLVRFFFFFPSEKVSGTVGVLLDPAHFPMENFLERENPNSEDLGEKNRVSKIDGVRGRTVGKF